MEIGKYDEYGHISSSVPLFDSREWAVENVGDGTGEFIWPRQRRDDGKWFGFDSDVLSIKRGQYLNQLHFRAQYYNDPHDSSSSPISRDLFQYYDPGHIHRQDYTWHFKRERL